MGQVALEIHGRRYEVACDDGEEERVRRLGAYVDQRARDLVASAGQVGEARLLLMTALLVADELFELAEASGDDAPRAPSAAARDAAESEAVEALDGVAERLERIAARLEGS